MLFEDAQTEEQSEIISPTFLDQRSRNIINMQEECRSYFLALI